MFRVFRTTFHCTSALSYRGDVIVQLVGALENC